VRGSTDTCCRRQRRRIGLEGDRRRAGGRGRRRRRGGSTAGAAGLGLGCDCGQEFDHDFGSCVVTFAALADRRGGSRLWAVRLERLQEWDGVVLVDLVDAAPVGLVGAVPALVHGILVALVDAFLVLVLADMVLALATAVPAALAGEAQAYDRTTFPVLEWPPHVLSDLFVQGVQDASGRTMVRCKC
jgi:hypothetical protein